MYIGLFQTMLFEGRNSCCLHIQAGYECGPEETAQKWLRLCDAVCKLVRNGTISKDELLADLQHLYVIFDTGRCSPTYMLMRIDEIFLDKEIHWLVSGLAEAVIADKTKEEITARKASAKRESEKNYSKKIAPSKTVPCPNCRQPLVVRQGESKKVRCTGCGTRFKLDEKTGAILGRM